MLAEATASNPLLSAEFLAGSFAGLAQCFLMIPIDVLKIRAQLQEKPPGATGYVAPADQLRSVLRHEGVAGRSFAVTGPSNALLLVHPVPVR
jgi:hypothetical protein